MMHHHTQEVKELEKSHEAKKDKLDNEVEKAKQEALN
jgi:hypothetical protein